MTQATNYSAVYPVFFFDAFGCGLGGVDSIRCNKSLKPGAGDFMGSFLLLAFAAIENL